jgi:hypothetical protein
MFPGLITAHLDRLIEINLQIKIKNNQQQQIGQINYKIIKI